MSGVRCTVNKTLKLKSLIPFADTHNAQQKLFFEIKAIGAAKDYFCSFNISLSTPAIKQNALPEKTEPKSFSYIPDLNFLLYSLAVKNKLSLSTLIVIDFREWNLIDSQKININGGSRKAGEE